MKRNFTHQIFIILIFLVSALSFNSLRAQNFVHPGGLHTQSDLDRMKAKVAAGAHPWIDDWNKLITDPQAQNTYKAKPQANMGVSRQQADNDAHAAYLNTLRWYISGDTTYANCAVRICNAWSYTVNQVPSGTDIPGLSGISIFDFALVGELLRVYTGWAPADFTQFKSMMLNYYYPVCNNFLTNHNGTCISSYWANWDACNIGAIMTIGVLCDDTAKYNQGVNYFKSGAGNGSINNAVYFIHPGGLGQWQESGRDQEHAQLGVGLLGSVCQVAWNQGLDLFGYNNNRLLAGAEYVARTNLSLPVPYQTYNNCDNVNQYYLSTNGLGRLDDRPVYELLYNHYVVLQGLSAPNVKAMADLQRPEHGSTDHFGYGTLAFTLDGNASPYPASPIAPVPTGLVATAGISQVSLDWAAPAQSTVQGYNILRSTNSGGPYTNISSWTASTYPHYTDNAVTNGVTYYYTISAINQSGTSAATSPVSAKPTAGTATFPTGWARKDVGAVTTTGSASYSVTPNTWIVSGSGSDVGGTADSHSYAFTSVSGDFTITARLANVNWVGSADKVGIVIRETLNPNAKRLTVNLGETGDRLARFGTRSTTGGNTTWQGGNQYTWVPVWLRLQRSGNVFTASQSSDGVTWFAIGTSTVAMANVYYAGLSVCAGSTSGTLNTSTFDNITLTGGIGSLPAAPATFTATALNNSQIKLLWTTSAGASAYKVKRSLSANGPFTVITSSLADTTFLDTGLVATTTYYYSLKAVNLAGESADSIRANAQTLSMALPPAPAGFTAVAGNSRVLINWSATLQSPTGYNVKRANAVGGPYTTIKSIAATSYIDSTAVNGALYFYSVSAVNALGEGPGSTPAVVFVGKKLTGTIIGTSGSFGNVTTTTKTAAMDGNLNTYFDSPSSNGSWVGLDLGSDSSAVIKLISFAPRSTFPQRMTGGIFQGANAADFSDAVNLYTISTQPAVGALIPVTVSNTGLFRYLRYLSPNGSNGNVAEINFFGNVQKGRSIPSAPSGLTAGIVKAKAVLNWIAATDAASYTIKRATTSGGPYTTVMTADTLTTYTDASVVNGATYYYVVTAVNRLGEGPASSETHVYVGNKLTGTLAGTTGSYNNNTATTKAAAVDGDLNTFFDSNLSSGAWVGYDFGTDSSAVVTSINYAPRTAYASRMVGGMFQGANKPDFSDAVTLFTVSAVPAYSVLTPQAVNNTGAYRYLRYLSPTGGSCNVAEIEFYGKLKGNQTITFNVINPKQVGDVDFDPGAIASSALPVSYTSSDTTIATILNGKIHLVAAGTSLITAVQAGNGAYTAAVPVSQSLTVNKKVQIITFNVLNPKTVVDTDFNAGATVSSGLPLSYLSSDSTVAKIVNGKIHITGAGSAVITASQVGNATYYAATSVTQSLVVTKLEQVITFNALNIKTVADTDFNAGATVSSGLPLSYSSSDSTVAKVVNGKIHITGAGSAVVTASQGGNTTYNAATSVTQSLTVNKLEQAITFNALNPKTVADTDFNAGATASSGLSLSYTSSDSTVAKIVNGKIHITGAGSTVVTASQGGNATYNAATSVTQTLTVSKLNQAITFNTLNPKTVADTDFNAGATVSSGLPLSYLSSDSTVAKIVNGKVHITGAGSTVLTVSQGGDETYNAAAPATQTLTVSKLNQVITFNALNTKTVADTDFNAGATVSSHLVLAYSSSDTTVAAILGGKIHIKGAGTITITASQGGNAVYLPAASVSQNLTVNKIDQLITFNALSPKNVNDTDFNAGATVSSHLSLNYSSSDSAVAKIVNGKIHITGAGATNITASQNGNATYNPANAVSQTLSVNKLVQTITFNALPVRRPGDADVALNAASSAGLPITFTSSNINVAVIVNGKLQIIGPGTSTIKASQPGNNTYGAAALSQTFTVIPLNLQVQYLDGDNGQLTNNTIRPYLKIVNADSVGVAYTELTMRYWFTAENYAGINTWIDYAQLGNNNVKMKYVQLDQPKNGALGYVEYSFAAIGNLGANNNTGPIQSRFANQDWSNLNEADDYSHQNNTGNYAVNNQITLYRNGVLIWGTEPAAVPALTSLNVSYQNQNQSSSGNTISTYLSVNNIGNVPVSYGDITARYWFTEDGTQNLNYWIDYAVKGSANVTGKFVKLSTARNGADTYFEIAVKSSVGTLYPLSTTGNIQYRIAKTDWSNFNELNDYSYLSKDVMKENNHITLYYKGQLIYGIEPAALVVTSLPQNSDSKPSLSNVSTPDPVVNKDGIVVHQGLSPNGDGINDFLVIEGLTAYPDNKLIIMDRNGVKVFEAKGYNNSTRVFDGHSSINGGMQRPGTYFYSLDYQVEGKNRHQTGFIVLKY